MATRKNVTKKVDGKNTFIGTSYVVNINVEREENIRKLCGELADFLVMKNRDYGQASFKQGRYGIAVHTSDKAYRIWNLLINKNVPNFEKVNDSLKDLAGYCILGLLILEEEKDGEKN